MYSILIIYCIGGFIAFCIWLSLFIRDSSTLLTDSLSWKILLLATLLWPVTVPASFVELLRHRWSRLRLTVEMKNKPSGVLKLNSSACLIEPSTPSKLPLTTVR